MAPEYPCLYQVNTRLLLSPRAATLDDVPDAELDRWAGLGFDWVWFLGVWRTGAAGRQIAVSDPGLRQAYREALPDFTDADVCGSCFAIAGMEASFGGEGALRRLRARLGERGMKLMLDFVPNHTALDHPWALEHPEFYVRGTETDLERDPHTWTRIGDAVMAHGRDPYFPAWTDTLQLNYGEEPLQQAMAAELVKVAGLCDGVRCDMAMLILPEVFERTWGIRAPPFWPRAIGRARAAYPEFVLMAEVYWGLEAALQRLGFDYTYDKTLYDRLRDRQTRSVRDHFHAELAYQSRCARFLENHDEPRAAAVFPEPVHGAAAVLSFLSPGLRFFHQGQLEGQTRRIPVQLMRAPEERLNVALREFYGRLLACLRRDEARRGDWRVLECLPAWDGNWTSDYFVCFSWEASRRLLVAVNYAGHQSQCFVRFPFRDVGGRQVRLADMLGEAVYDRRGDDLLARGLYLDMPPWGHQVFDVTLG